MGGKGQDGKVDQERVQVFLFSKRFLRNLDIELEIFGLFLRSIYFFEEIDLEIGNDSKVIDYCEQIDLLFLFCLQENEVQILLNLYREFMIEVGLKFQDLSFILKLVFSLLFFFYRCRSGLEWVVF